MLLLTMWWHVRVAETVHTAHVHVERVREASMEASEERSDSASLSQTEHVERNKHNTTHAIGGLISDLALALRFGVRRICVYTRYGSVTM